MKRTPANIVFHELLGLTLRVDGSSDTTLLGRSGIVMDETRNLLRIKSNDKLLSLPKRSLKATLTLPSGQTASVLGDLLVARAEERILKMRR